jgi:SPP1 family predicted phage head-tail adaptor
MAYNDKIVIQQSTDTRGDAGGVEETWVTYKTVWADIDDLSGSKENTSDMPVYEDSMSFKIHAHDAPAVTTKMRISWNSQYWYIRSKQRDGRLRFMLIADAYDDE